MQPPPLPPPPLPPRPLGPPSPPWPPSPPPAPPPSPIPLPFDQSASQTYPDLNDLLMMLLIPSVLAGVLALARLARARHIESFEHLSSAYDKPSTTSLLGTLGSITLALTQLLMYGAFVNRFAEAGTLLTTPWFNASVRTQLANYVFTVMGDYIKLFFFATELDMPNNLVRACALWARLAGAPCGRACARNSACQRGADCASAW